MYYMYNIQNDAISMQYIHYTYNQSAYPNVDHNRDGKTWSTS